MRRCLALALALALLVGRSSFARAETPAADDPRTLHQLGEQLRAAGQHLEAARQWLRALDAIVPTPEHESEIESHFCEAMESLTTANGPDSRTDVRQVITPRLDRLDASAALIRKHGNPINLEVCLDRWTTLSQLAAPQRDTTRPTDEPATPVPGPNATKPVHTSAPRGHWAGLGVSLAGVSAGAVMLGVGGARMKDSYEAARTTWTDSDVSGMHSVCGNDPAAPTGVAADCSTYHSQRIVAAVGAGVLATSLISTVVFAGLLGRHRARHQATLAGARIPGGALLQAFWRF